MNRDRQKGGRLSVRLLETGTGTPTTKLLGLATTVVGDEEGTVELDKGLLEEVLGVLVDELLVVGDEGLGDGLTDGVDLGGVTTAGDADADVDVGEFVEADDEERFVDLHVTRLVCLPIVAMFKFVWSLAHLEAENLGLDELERTAVDLDETLTSLFLLVAFKT